MSNYLVDGNDMSTIFYKPATVVQGPSTNYKINSSDISTIFTLYMHGTRKKTNYLTLYNSVATDVGFFYQVDTPAYVKVLGNYNLSTWTMTATTIQNAKWIWATTEAATDANGILDGYAYWFYYTFQNKSYLSKLNFNLSYRNNPA
jgi:hypothetical protein